MDARSLATANQRLQEEFAQVFSAETIVETLRDSTDELTRNARVDNFVPLLAERRTRERLLAIARF